MSPSILDIQNHINHKTKPLGALGTLETLGMQICKIQNTLHPELQNPTILVFAGDHGIVAEGVSAYPTEVTIQMVHNFLQGGAAINVFCRQNGIDLKIIDAGVNHDFENTPNLIDAKVGKGTKNFLHSKAMTSMELALCFENAGKIVHDVAEQGCNIIGFGEMGIGNTSAASMIMSAITKIPIADCVGRGTGLVDAQLANKIEILAKAQQNHLPQEDALEILETFGGFEIAQMCGAMLKAYSLNMIVMIDGFIASAALLCAREIEPDIMDNIVFCHQSDEQGHQRLLAQFGATPLVSLGMRVGEGTGCAVAYPIIKSAVAFLNEMASFDSAGVSNKAS